MTHRSNAKHVREHASLLMQSEKRLLTWIAQRLPDRVSPDHLSLVGLLAMLLAGLAFWASQWEPRALLIVVVALALNWFGDSLDGTLARVRNRQRPRYGFYVDHVIDVAGTFFLLGGLAVSSYMTSLIALGVLVAYLMVCAESFLAAHTIGVFRMAYLGIGPTELRILLAAGTLFLLFKTTVPLAGFGRFLLFDIGGVCAIAALAVTFIVSAVRNTVALYREETVR
jgi:archaetidylinositol phosphate synthase